MTALPIDFESLCAQSGIQPTIAFLGGGNMANALVHGFIRSKLVKPGQIVVCDRNEQKREAFRAQGIHSCSSAGDVLHKYGGGLVFLTVKPHCLQHVLGDNVKSYCTQPGLLVSVLSGITIETIRTMVGDVCVPIARVMPNTPCLIGCGAAVFAIDQRFSTSHTQLLRSLLETVALVHHVNESQINAVCGLSGSGPAFVYTFLDAMSDAGVKAGLPRALSTQLAAQTIYGAAKMQLETGLHPGELKNSVCSPGGTTIAGIQALEEGKFRATVMHAVEASVHRADHLADKK